jgi:copper chaperone CopZ
VCLPWQSARLRVLTQPKGAKRRPSEQVHEDIELVIGGMTCRRCVREVTSRLRDVPGVERVTANPARSLVHLSGSMTLADVLAAFEGTTYRSVVQRGA